MSAVQVLYFKQCFIVVLEDSYNDLDLQQKKTLLKLPLLLFNVFPLLQKETMAEMFHIVDLYRSNNHLFSLFSPVFYLLN